MAIRQFGTVSFAGVDLSTFGVTLSGVGTYNAPERDVEYVEVPGRNGDIIIDHGRFKNIEVTYPVNIEDNLPTNIEALTTYLLSKRGYQRLEDSRHPDVYRMANFVGAVEVDPTGRHNRYGTTELTFNCKPQKFLTSGDTAILTIDGTAIGSQTIGVGDVIFNAGAISQLQSFGADTSDIYTVIDIRSYLGGLHPFDHINFYFTDDHPEPLIYASVRRLSHPSGYGWLENETYTSGQIRNVYIGMDNEFIATHASADEVEIVIKGRARWDMYGTGSYYITGGTPNDGTITPPAGVHAYAPLLEIGVSGAVSGDVAYLGSDLITLNTPATVGEADNPQTLSTIYIDCATLNAYTIIDNVLFNLNKYVTLTGEFLYPGDAPTTFYINSLIDSLTVRPRWYKI